MRRLSGLIALLFAGVPVFGQTPIEPAKLPKNTVAYVAWRGMNSQPNLQQENSLLALWNDPDFAPARAAMAKGLLSDNAKKSPGQKLDAADLQEFSALLENAFVLGFVSGHAKQITATPAGSSVAPAKWDGSFFVYDTSGKEVLLVKLLAKLKAGETEAPKVTRFQIGSVEVEEETRKTGTTYHAMASHSVVIAGERSVLEEIIHRLPGGPGGSGALGDSPAFLGAQKELPPASTLELFVRVPAVSELVDPGSANMQGQQLQKFFDGMRIDAVHALCVSLTLDGPQTRFRGAVLGDTSPGTPFDLLSSSEAPFASLPLPPADAISYSATRADFLGFYRVLRKGLEYRLPQGQAGMVGTLEGAAATRLGMPLEDALGLFSGEIASFSTRADLDPQGNVYVFGINKKPETLKLMRTLLTDRISSERAEGDTTFLKISLNSQETGAGVAQWKFYYAAVTPSFVLGASRGDTLRTLLAGTRTPGNSGASVTAGGLAAQPGFQQARAHFPEKLAGIGYVDFTRVNWVAARDRWRKEIQTMGSGKDQAAQATEMLDQFNPEVFARHLHTMASGSWKDAQGVHFDAWIQ